ncbi:autotransporter outer membrane beta-barrel domain-containing protein [Iodidimonas sp. SYSU 1G8]|uniref:autotransporter outer membrane beta-barrel domain-containing protein n=1 Tax=Iodidimonas sp. SYSU 1G8 TaxID=3133967 RepID=UPI0031FE79A3
MINRFNGRLRLSVSILALAAGGTSLPMTAQALTITGSQTEVNLGPLVENVTIATGATVTPDGVGILSIDGFLVNNGTVTGSDSDLLAEDFSAVTNVTGLFVSGAVTDGVTNAGAISANANSSVNADYEAVVDGSVSGSGSAGASSLANAVLLSTVEGNFTNSGDIAADASSSISGDVVLDATGSIDVSAGAELFSQAYGVAIYSIDGSFLNAVDSTISAEAMNQVALTLDATALSSDADQLAIDSLVVASGVQITEADAVINAGTVTVSAAHDIDVVGSLEATDGAGVLSLGNDVDQSVTAVGIAAAFTTELSNSGAITVSADANTNVALETSASLTSYAGVYGHTVSAGSVGVLGVVDGDAANSGAITATASSVLDIELDATGDEGDVTSQVYGGLVTADTSGIALDGDIDSFSNSAAVTATATAMLTFDGTSTDIDGESSDWSWVHHDETSVAASAAGIELGGDEEGLIGDVSNSSDISAQATASLTNTGVALGDSGWVTSTNGVLAEAIGLFAKNVNGDVSNTGTISSTASASSLTDSTTGATGTEVWGLATADENVVASAWGVQVDGLEGTFSNAADAAIAATASAVLDVDLNAFGETAYATAFTAETLAIAQGVLLTGGVSSLENTGAISATATGTSTIDASAVGEVGAYAESDRFQGVYAAGIYVDGVSSGLDNAGDVTATATSSVLQTLSTTGADVNDVRVTNELYATAEGIIFDAPISGDVVNSGTVAATAALTLDLTVVSGTAEDPGVVLVDNFVGVYAAGVSGIFAAPPVEEDDEEDEQSEAAVPVPYSFTNSGDITAAGTLTLDLSVPAGTEESYHVTTALLSVVGADIGGDVGVVTNSGTISAAGTVNAVGAGDNIVSASVVGLWLPDADAGLDVINSGTISASLAGTGATDTGAAAIVLGGITVVEEPDPDDEGGEDDPDQGEGTIELSVLAIDEGEGDGGEETAGETGLPTDTLIYTTAATDVITLTNSGTISATNAQGISYGVYAENAPAPVVINQQGGTISAEVALALFQGNADTVNWTGGTIAGIVDADEFDVVNVFDGTGTPANKTIVAPEDFLLLGGAALNIGGEDAPVTFILDGGVIGTEVVNVNADANLVMGPTSGMVIGTFNMDEDSTLTFEILPDTAGFIGTVGDANIDGTLVVSALPGLYGDEGSHLVIESLGLVNGTFDNVNVLGDTLLLDFAAVIGEQDVTIVWERTPFDGVPGLTINASSVAGALEAGYDPLRPSSTNDPELNDILAGLFTLTNGATYDRVLNSWSGSEHAQVMRAAANLSEPYHMAVSEHLNDIRRSGAPDGQVVMLRPNGSSTSIAPASAAGASGAEESGIAFWGRAYGRWADTRGDIEADGYDEETFGAVLGADFHLGPNVVLGVVGGYGDDSIDFDDGDEGKIKRWSIGGYVSATMDRFYIDGSLTYASDSYKVNRTIVYGDTSCLAFNCTDGASSKYDGDGWLAHAEVGYVFAMGEGTSLQPFAGLNYSTVSLDPFSEAGGGDLGLDVLAGKGKSLQSRLGARLTGEWGSGSTKWVPELRVEWRHEFEDQPAWIGASLNGLSGNPFTTIGSEVTEDLAVIGAGVTAIMSNGVGIFFDYQAAFGSGYNSHIFQGGVRVKF